MVADNKKMQQPVWTEVDERITAALRSRLPRRVCDAHAHLYRLRETNLPEGHFLRAGPVEVSLRDWRNDVARLVGEQRLTTGLFMAFPSAGGNLEACNQYLIEQLHLAPEARGLVLVRPDTGITYVEQILADPQVVGFKPYHFYSPSSPTYEASLESFVPEWMWKSADERELIMTLHLVMNRALADENNWRTICRTAERYPRARIILAHAARGFNPWHTVEGIEHLKGLENIWFDTSAVSESRALLAILDAFGPRKLLWGTDYPACELRGKCVSVADAFLWLGGISIDLDWESLSPKCEPTTVGIESLRALFDAADQFGLNASDMEDIFANNALSLLELKQEPRDKTGALYQHAKLRIPGGTQLLGKRPEQFAPQQWPAYFREARGCEVWDLDGKRYFDMSVMGIGSCLLGYRDPDVTHAVTRRLNLGSMSTLNPPEEVELADLLCELHPWAERVRFARTGGEAMAVAVRIARATTGRSLVAICGYHGWHDWYLAANLGEADTLRGHLLPGLDPNGVPSELRGTVLAFNYNDANQFNDLVSAHGNRLAAVVMEPCRNRHPEPGFLEQIRERTRAQGILWVIDEITAGFRMALGGAHLNYNVTPDIAVLAKALGNGHPIAAVIGTREAMAGAESSFISSTYWTESIGPSAALAVLRKMQRIDVPGHVERIGSTVQECWRASAKKHDLKISVEGFPCLSYFTFQHEKAAALRTLYTQWMLGRGFLDGARFYPSLAHTEEAVSRYATAVDHVFAQIADAVRRDEVGKELKGPIAESGFRRLT